MARLVLVALCSMAEEVAIVNISAPLHLLQEPRKIPPESAKAKRCYADYESMGADRSLAKLVQQMGKPSAYVRQLERWSHDYGWVQRIKDYENRQLESRRKKRQDELEAMDERHSNYGRASLFEAIKYINDHLNDPGTTIAQAVSLMKASYELERLARGAATTRIEGDMVLAVLPKEYINIDPDECGSEP